MNATVDNGRDWPGVPGPAKRGAPPSWPITRVIEASYAGDNTFYTLDKMMGPGGCRRAACSSSTT